MKNMKLHLANLESDNFLQSYSDRNFHSSPFMYKTLQAEPLKKSFTTRIENLKSNAKNLNFAQQRQAIRNLLDQDSPKNAKPSQILQITGNQKGFKKFSLSPALIRKHKPLLSPVNIKKPGKGDAPFEKSINRSDTLNSVRRSVPFQALVLENSEPDSCEDSLRIESRYFQNNIKS
jgi:hypothetical protein